MSKQIEFWLGVVLFVADVFFFIFYVVPNMQIGTP